MPINLPASNRGSFATADDDRSVTKLTAVVGKHVPLDYGVPAVRLKRVTT